MSLKPLIAGQFYTSGGGGGGDMTKAVYDPANIASQVAGTTVANIFSVNGAASTPAMTLAGTIFTGGSATTTKPQLLIEPTGTTSTAWSTSGTMLGVNAPNAFAGLLFDGQVNGVPAVRLFANGSLAVGNTGSSGAGYIQSEGNTAIYAFGLLMRNDAQVAWSSTGGYSGTKDLFLQRKAAATLQLGADAAGVTNQMITAANRITSDGVGANLTIAPGNGRGGAGGSLILSTYTTAGAGVAGTLTTQLTLTIGQLQFADAVNMAFGDGTGTKIGTAANQLLGFWGATPVDQPAFIADPTGGATEDVEARASIVSILDLLIETGFMASS